MKNKILNYFKGKDFLKNASVLLLGTASAQFLPIIFYPILTRIYSPSDFGLFASLSAITTILVTLSTGKYEFSILITETKKDGVSVIHLVLFFSSCILLLVTILFLVFSDSIASLMNNQELKKWILISPVTAFFIVIFNSFNEWCVKNKYFTPLSYNKVINAGATTFSKVFFGFVGVLSAGLVIGDSLGRFISALGCVIRGIKKDRDLFLKIDIENSKKLLFKYINFPKYTLPAQLLNTLGGQLPIFLIGYFFSKNDVGFFSMTIIILSIPIKVISQAIRDVFRQKANQELKAKGSCRHIYVKLFKMLSLVSLVVVCVVFYFLPYLFSLVLGEEWEASGEFAQILSPMIVLSFISNALGGVLIITENLKPALYWQIYYVTVALFSLLISGFLFNDNIKQVLIIYASAMSSAYILQIILSYHYSEIKIIDE